MSRGNGRGAAGEKRKKELRPGRRDLNPDEHVWSYLKGLFRQDPLAKDEDLIEAVNSQMHHVQSNPALVRAFFDHPAVAYVKQALKW